MKTTISLLLDLQKLDLERKELESKKTALPVTLKAIEDDFNKLTARLDERRKELREKNIEIDRMELDVKSIDEKVNRFQIQLNAASSNKEYSALQHEIGALQADKEVIEDSMFEILDRTEELEAEISSLKSVLEEKEEKFERTKVETAQKERDFSTDIGKLEGCREELARQIDPDTFQTYERLLTRYEGEVLVRVAGQSCGGCHMSLTPQTINLLMQNEQLVTCKSCGRILYLNE